MTLGQAGCIEKRFLHGNERISTQLPAIFLLAGSHVCMGSTRLALQVGGQTGYTKL